MGQNTTVHDIIGQHRKIQDKQTRQQEVEYTVQNRLDHEKTKNYREKTGQHMTWHDKRGQNITRQKI